jgi:hypothetical protein
MAKYFIFSNDTNQLCNIVDSEENKNSFISNQIIYTAVEATESQYNDVRLGAKTAKLNNGVLSVVDFDPDSFEIILNTYSVEQIKKQIKIFIQIEINNLKSKGFYDSQYENALKAINVDSLNSIPNQKTIPNWVLSQINIAFKRPFEA